ncbi:MAG: DUF3616 domain-containing protein [Reyranellaceae bacterium]
MPGFLSPDEARSVSLDLGDKAVILEKNGKTQEVIRNLSGAAIIGKHIYLANDEGRELLQLERTQPRLYDKVRAIKLAALFDIADETTKRKEFDLEALALDRIDEGRSRLWLIGSHAMGHTIPDGSKLKLKRLGLKRERNRLLFGCINVGEGGLDPSSGRHLRIRPVGQTHTTDFLDALRAAPPPASGLLQEVSALADLRFDKDAVGNIGWFTPYTLASTKENGLDIEGLAIRRRDGDDTQVIALVGLRGPVIDGLAVLIEVKIRDHHARGLKVVGAPRFHLLDLDGFGVRDLEWRGKDLLILAGPTMTRQKESALFRWNDAWKDIKQGGKSVVEVHGIQEIGSLPMPEEHSGPEVITRIAEEEPEYMVLRDGVGRARLCNNDGTPTDLGPVYRTEVYRIDDR